jgi:transposase-like protein
MRTVFNIDPFRKKERPIRCPHCASLAIIRHGKYQRGHPLKPTLVDIQRFRCKSPHCPWQTFSILPYPFLPIVRHFYTTLRSCHTLLNRQGISQAQTARRLGLTRGIIKRLSAFCSRFIPWVDQEKRIADWGCDPEEIRVVLWPDFTRDMSQVFYPKRWRMYSPTQ